MVAAGRGVTAAFLVPGAGHAVRVVSSVLGPSIWLIANRRWRVVVALPPYFRRPDPVAGHLFRGGLASSCRHGCFGLCIGEHRELTRPIVRHAARPAAGASDRLLPASVHRLRAEPDARDVFSPRLPPAGRMDHAMARLEETSTCRSSWRCRWRDFIVMIFGPVIARFWRKPRRNDRRGLLSDVDDGRSLPANRTSIL